MSKSILILDTPKTCLDCRFCRELHEGIEACCELSDEPEDKTLCRMIDADYCQEKPDWCPLKDVPSKIEKATGDMDYYKAIGFNACIDEILKESN